MKKVLLTIAAVVCCAMTMSIMLTSCEESEDKMLNKLIGTWTEKNDLFTDVLTLNEDNTFQFSSHLQNYNGSGYYVFERDHKGGIGSQSNVVATITLNYAGKSSSYLVIHNLTNSTLEVSDRFGNKFTFKK